VCSTATLAESGVECVVVDTHRGETEEAGSERERERKGERERERVREREGVVTFFQELIVEFCRLE
jgi:hypothetical protein